MNALENNNEATPLESSNISSVAYSDATKTLTISFHAGGTYEYYDVPEIVHYEIQQSASAGKYFHRFIRSTYKYKQVG